MGSSFFGFNIARSGLFAAQKALNTVSHNIANANTEGFTRQRLEMHSSNPDAFPGKPGVIGTGVDTEHVQQIRDEFMDFKFRKEQTSAGEWGAKETVLKNIEAILNEPSESGIREVLDQFFSSIQELNKTPESLTTRALVRQRGIALAKTLGGMYETLEKTQRDLNFEVRTNVSEINGYADRVAEFNRVIYQTELNGSSANDIRDQRNLLLDKMSELADINYYEDSLNRFHVDINGHKIVSHYRADHLVTKERTTKKNEFDVEKLLEVEWESGATFNITSGKIKGILDMRDNIEGMDKGIPYYLDKLNEFADTLSEEINRVHKTGYDLRGGTGVNFFTVNNKSTAEYEAEILASGFNGDPAVDVTSQVMTGTSSTKTTAENDKIIRDNIAQIVKNTPDFKGKSIKPLSNGRFVVADRRRASELTISKDVEDELEKLATSDRLAGVPGNGANALRIGDVRHNVALFDWGSADDFVKALVSNLGVDTQQSTRISENSEVLLNFIKTNKMSVSGVSLDEEMSEMVKFQHSYNANARMINTMDEMLDLIVNRLGTVGR